MRARWLFVGISACLTAIGFGQSPNFPHVPDNHYAYEALRDFDRFGLWENPFRGMSTSNFRRDEIAIAIVRASAAIHEHPALLVVTPGTTPERKEVIREHLADLAKDMRLLREIFKPDIRALGLDPAWLALRFEEDMRTLNAAVATADAPSLVPDSGETRWIYDELRSLKKAGMLLFLPTLVGSYRDQADYRDRYQGAATVYSAFARIHGTLAHLRQKNDRLAGIEIKLDPYFPDHELASKGAVDAFYAKAVHHEQSLKRLASFYRGQLVSMGVDADSMTSQLDRDLHALKTFRFTTPGEAEQPFPDVPAGHWAAEASRNMRENGIMRGYENGIFGG